MSESDLKTKVIGLIAQQFNHPEENISPDDDLAKDYGAKSHDIIQLSARVQAACGVKITYIQSRNAKTVADWVQLAESSTK